MNKALRLAAPDPSIFARKRTFPLLIAGLIAVVLTAMAVGAAWIAPGDIITWNLDDQQRMVLLYIRLPRILLAIVIGAGLAVSGAALQGLFRNPLADPGLIGVSSGAALAVAATVVLAGPVSGYLALYRVNLAAFIGAIASCLTIFALVRGHGSTIYMMLAGIAINTIAAAGTGVMTYISNDEQLRTLTFWTMGSLGGALWPTTLAAIIVIVPASLLLVHLRGQINLLMLGADDAVYLGVNVTALRRLIILCSAMAVGASVASGGMIGFIGLIAPHLMRMVVGADNRQLIPASALFGAILLCVADTIGRTAVAPAEMPVGVITSLIGGPFFLWLLTRQTRRAGR